MDTIQSSPTPKYRQIAETLIQEMSASPDFVLKSQRILAAQFGVNRLTIQHALDWMEREGVLKRLPGRGYAAASRISSEGGGEGVIGYPLWVNSYGEIDSLRAHNRMRWIEDVHRALQGLGYQLDVQCVGLPHRPNRARIRELSEKWKAVILEPMEGDSEIFPDNPFYGMIDRAVLIGAIQGRRCNCVCPDFHEGARDAVRELIRLGASRILFTGRSNESASHRFLRVAGAESAVDPLSPVKILFAEGGAHYEEAFSAVKRFFRDGGECDAIVASSAMGAMATCRALADLGIRTPDEVQLIGIGGGSLIARMVPRPTVLESKGGVFAESIAHMAIALSGRKVVPQTNILVPMYLTQGETTRESRSIQPSPSPFVEGLRHSMRITGA